MTTTPQETSAPARASGTFAIGGELSIAEALHPYPDGLVIATKGGLRRGGHPDGRPERLRADCELSLLRLRLDTIDLVQVELGAHDALRLGDRPRDQLARRVDDDSQSTTTTGSCLGYAATGELTASRSVVTIWSSN